MELVVFVRDSWMKCPWAVRDPTGSHAGAAIMLASKRG